MNTRLSESIARVAMQLRPCACAVIVGLVISIAAAGSAPAQNNKVEVGEMIDDLVTANHILYN